MRKHSQTQSCTNDSVLKRDRASPFFPEMNSQWPSFHRATRTLLDVDLLSSSLLHESESCMLPPIYFKATPQLQKNKLHSQFSCQNLEKSPAFLPKSPPKPRHTSPNSPVLKLDNRRKWKRKKRVSKRELSPESSDEEEGVEAWYRLPGSGFGEVMDCVVEDLGAFPYLTLAERRSLSPMRKQALHTTWWYTKGKPTTSALQCTCRPQLYLHPSLHYQQLFLKSALKDSAYKGLGQLRLVTRSAPQRTAQQVIIVHFEGVLGCWQRQPYQSDLRLLLRSEMANGLMKLAGGFRLILIVAMKRRLISPTLRYFQSQGINFEAVYSLRYPDFRKIPVLNYAKITSELNILDSAAKLLVISRLDLTCEEADTLEDLYWKSGCKLRLHAANMPIPSSGSRSPLTLLVPNLEAQERGKAISFAEIAKAVFALHALCESAWLTGFYCLLQHPQPGFRSLSTSAVHEVLMSAQLSAPTPESFARAQISHVCALHRKLAWGLGPSLLPFSSSAVIVTSHKRERGDAETVDTKQSAYEGSLLEYSVS